MAQHRALVVGATGITGRNTGEHLAELGWEVFGISRSVAQGVTWRHARPGRHLEPGCT